MTKINVYYFLFLIKNYENIINQLQLILNQQMATKFLSHSLQKSQQKLNFNLIKLVIVKWKSVQIFFHISRRQIIFLIDQVLFVSQFPLTISVKKKSFIIFNLHIIKIFYYKLSLIPFIFGRLFIYLKSRINGLLQNNFLLGS